MKCRVCHGLRFTIFNRKTKNSCYQGREPSQSSTMSQPVCRHERTTSKPHCQKIIDTCGTARTIYNFYRPRRIHILIVTEIQQIAMQLLETPEFNYVWSRILGITAKCKRHCEQRHCHIRINTRRDPMLVDFREGCA